MNHIQQRIIIAIISFFTRKETANTKTAKSAKKRHLHPKKRKNGYPIPGLHLVQCGSRKRAGFKNRVYGYLFAALLASGLLLITSAIDVSAQCTSPPSAPSITATAGPLHREITVTSSVPGDASQTVVYYSSDGTTFNNVLITLTPGSNMTYTSKSWDTFKKYYFKATATNSCGEASSVVTSATTLDIDAPTVTATAGSNPREMTVTASVPDGASKTTVYYSEDGTNFKLLTFFNAGADNTYTSGRWDTFKKYYFKAIAISGTREKESPQISATTLDIETPTITATAGPKHQEMTVTASIPDGASKTTVYYSEDGTNFKLLTFFNAGADNTYTSGRWDTFKKYYFKAIAISGTREKESPQISATTLDIETPTITATAGPKHQEMTVTASVPDGASKTTVYYSEDGTNFKLLTFFNAGSDNTYTSGRWDTFKKYYFKATAISGTREKESPQISATTLDIETPTITATAGPKHQEMTVTASVPTGASRTTIYYSEDGTNFKLLTFFIPNSFNT